MELLREIRVRPKSLPLDFEQFEKALGQSIGILGS